MIAHHRSFPFRSLAAPLVGAITLLVHAASAYNIDDSWPAGSNVTFQVNLGSPSRTLRDGNTSWNSAAQPAMQQWDDVMARLYIGSSLNTSGGASRGDSVCSIAWSNTAFGSSWDNSTLAVTGWSTSSGKIVEADIVFNPNMTFDSYRGPLSYQSNGYPIMDIQRVMTHELGHALGLGHSGADAIMNKTASDRYLLSTDDINGAQASYGAPATSPSPTPTPSATPDATPPPVSGPTITVAGAPSGVSLGGTSVFTVSTSVAQSVPMVVTYTMSGNAVLGLQYSMSAAGEITIPAGATSASATLTVLKTGKRSKVATMTLQSSPTYNVDSLSSTSVTILRKGARTAAETMPHLDHADASDSSVDPLSTTETLHK